MNQPYLALPVLGRIVVFANLVPLIIALIKHRKPSADMVMLLAYLSFSALTTMCQYYFGEILGLENLWMSHFFSLLEYQLLILLYSLWAENQILKSLLRLSVIFFAAFWIWAKVNLEKIVQPAVYTPSVGRLIITCVSLYFIFYFVRQPGLAIGKSEKFWITLATLILCAGSLTFFMFRNIIPWLPPHQVLIAFHIHWLNIIVANGFYSWAILIEHDRSDIRIVYKTV